MLSQVIPFRVCVRGKNAGAPLRLEHALPAARREWNGLHRDRGTFGPLRLALYQSAGCQGSRVDSGALPGGYWRGTASKGLYVYPSLYAEALDCGGHALLAEIDALLAPLSPYSEERDAYAATLYGESEVLKVDGEGRVSLTETMKAQTSITTEATFVGEGHKFQIWEPSRFRAHLEEAQTPSARPPKAAQFRTCGGPGGPAASWSTGLMSDRGAGGHLAAGGPVRHHPVLRAEAITALAVRPGGLYVDGTFGAGGYTSSILATPGTQVVALDRDPTAIAAGLAGIAGDTRLTLVEARFGTLDAVVDRLSLPPLDGVVLDIGVSSMQFDEAEAGLLVPLRWPRSTCA